MEQCHRCGRHFFSTSQFKTINENGQNLFVCPECIYHFNQKEKKKELEYKKKLEEQQSSEEMATKTSEIKCPFCGRLFKKISEEQHRVSEELIVQKTAPTVEDKSSIVQISSQKRFCPYCAYKLDGTPKFCPECGKKL